MNDWAPVSKFTFSCQPDISVYHKSIPGPKPKLNTTLVEFLVEFKTTLDQDPFVVEPTLHSDLKSASENPFMNTTNQGRQSSGQITAYATSILSSQYCTHVFLVLIVDTYARLIHWDRGGAVVTAPIHYDQDPHLFDFFIRCDANPAVRGSNPTV